MLTVGWTADSDEPAIATTDLALALEKAKEILGADDLADEAGGDGLTEDDEEADVGEECDEKVSQQLRRVARVLRYQIATREPFVAEGTADVQVATLWGAKGVTADHVYVIGLCGEALPGERRPEYPGTELEYFEEQRRLFYVSLTGLSRRWSCREPQRSNAVWRSRWASASASPEAGIRLRKCACSFATSSGTYRLLCTVRLGAELDSGRPTLSTNIFGPIAYQAESGIRELAQHFKESRTTMLVRSALGGLTPPTSC